MIAQLRMLIAEWLLGLAVEVAPLNPDGAVLMRHVIDYYLEAWQRK